MSAVAAVPNHIAGGKSATDNRYPYLDASRIFAAAAVYAFHAGIPGTAWGYIGVDFFMVLSGFVVTLAVLNADGMGVGRFLTARLSRLIPGMLLFLAVSAAILVAFASYDERMSVLGYILPSGLYYSNWYSIFAADNYFNQNNINIFIHIWSLSVEEQFYVFFALILLVPGKHHVKIKLFVIAALAAALIQQHSSMSHDRFYFGTESRAIQFLTGSLIAHFRGPIQGLARRIPTLVAWPALAIAAAACIALTIDHDRYFYGGYIATTIAAVMFLAMSIRNHGITGEPNIWVARLGHASYTQYLLHLPLIFVMSKLFLTEAPAVQQAINVAGLVALLLISLVVSIGYEIPAQKYFRRMQPRIVLVILPVALAVTAFASFAAVRWSVPEAVRNTNLATGYYFCPDRGKPCRRAGNADRPAILFLGDSVGSSLVDGALTRYVSARNDIAYVAGAQANCAIRARPTIQPSGVVHVKHQRCFDNLPGIIGTALKKYDVRLVVVSSATDGFGLLSEDGKPVKSNDPRWLDESTSAQMAALAPFIEASIPILFLAPPQQASNMECMVTGDCSVARKATTPVGSYYRQLAGQMPGAHFVDANEFVCGDTECELVINGKISRYDGRHFTRDGSRELSQAIGDRIVPLMAPKTESTEASAAPLP